MGELGDGVGLADAAAVGSGGQLGDETGLLRDKTVKRRRRRTRFSHFWRETSGEGIVGLGV